MSSFVCHASLCGILTIKCVIVKGVTRKRAIFTVACLRRRACSQPGETFGFKVPITSSQEKIIEEPVELKRGSCITIHVALTRYFDPKFCDLKPQSRCTDGFFSEHLHQQKRGSAVEKAEPSGAETGLDGSWCAVLGSSTPAPGRMLNWWNWDWGLWWQLIYRGSTLPLDWERWERANRLADETTLSSSPFIRINSCPLEL